MSFANLLDVLHEDNHLIGLNKPSGWPTAHYDGTEETVDRLVKSYLKEKHGKPGNVYLGVVHRLDKPVSGALVFARTSKAAARLCEQFRNGAIEKDYWAVVEESSESAAPPWAKQECGSLDDWLLSDAISHRVRVVPPDTPGGRAARVLFQVRGRHDGLVWLELRPHTGRKHQLRVQLASRGCPVYGDKKYGSLRPLGDAIALHARGLTFLHPVRHEPVSLKADLPKHWRGRFTRLMQGAVS